MKIALFQTKLAWENPEINRTFIEEYFLNEDLKIVITGYDGVFSIPSEGIKLLESIGFNCEEIK